MSMNPPVNLSHRIRRYISRQPVTNLIFVLLSGLAVVIAPIVATNVDGGTNPCKSKEAEERLFCEANPAVVKVEVGNSSGSGVILSADGLVLTNAHVVGEEKDVRISFPDTQTGGDVYVSGKVVGYGPEGLDLAAIQLTGEGFDYVQSLADSVAVGQRVYAIGTQVGQFRNTLTAGIVSRVDTENGLIQTDAAINPGSSGGPLLNSEGELVGINTAIYSREGIVNTGIAFAISVEEVEEFLQLVEDDEAPTEPTTPPIPRRVLVMDGTFSPGELTAQSPTLEDDSFFDVYVFEGRAGQQVELAMQSQDVDSYLILLGPDGELVAEDNDSLGNGHAGIALTLPADGVYTVLANTYEAGDTGRYQIGGLLTDADQNANQSQSTN